MECVVYFTTKFFDFGRKFLDFGRIISQNKKFLTI